jgi:hypothetical protein
MKVHGTTLENKMLHDSAFVIEMKQERNPTASSIQVKPSQDTDFRMPNKWHECKEGQAGNNKGQCHGLLIFLSYLDFLRP